MINGVKPHPASWWQATENDHVRCGLCPHHCDIAPGQVGDCRVRKNINGKLYADGYANTVALNVDPIEKKPLYHFFPGQSILSVGPNGCNLHCRFCQNHFSSQSSAPTDYFLPEQVVHFANRPGVAGVAFTYTEPLIWYEYVMDTVRACQRAGFSTACVSNGYISLEPLEELLGAVDAFNFDLKSFSDDFYRSQCGGRLYPVLRTIETAIQSPAHVEVTLLLIPNLNDSPEEVGNLCRWLAERDQETPLHLSRYHPSWKLKLPPTPIETMTRSWSIAREAGLKHVYLGNVLLDDKYTETRCPDCDAVLIKRQSHQTKIIGLEGETCAACGRKINIVNSP